MENTNQTIETTPIEVTEAPQMQLYSIKGITLATFFGSIFAGGLFISMNFKRMGKEKEASSALIYTILATIAVFAVMMIIPDDVNIPSIVYIIPQVLAMQKIAEAYQKKDLDKHESAGGEFVSNWAVFGYSLLICAAIVMIFFGVLVLAE